MNVSVGINAYTLDRGNALDASVQCCFDQTERPSEIVVVIDRGADPGISRHRRNSFRRGRFSQDCSSAATVASGGGER
jgi:hypothetical protein